jgi:hypothetical protein
MDTLRDDHILRMEREDNLVLQVLAAEASEASELNSKDDLVWRLPESRRFENSEFVAAGGLGNVESVTDSCLARKVAWKRLRPGIWPGLLARELRLLARLQHPNIVPLYEITIDENNQPNGYTMPLFQGQSLHAQAKHFHTCERDSANAHASLAELLRAFCDVCRAIEHAHSRGVWHLDIKGANVLVDSSGSAVVVDWNLAQTIDDPPSVRSGTPGYQAPEQLTGGPVGPLTDVHGLGALLYELLTGRPPYSRSQTDGETSKSNRVIPPRVHWPSVPPALEAICLKALAVDPSLRYRRPEELRTEVERWQQDDKVEAYQEPSIRRLARWCRHHPRFTGILLTFMFVTLPILLAWIVHVDRAHRETEQALNEARANFAEVLRAGDQYFARMANSRLLQMDGLQSLRQQVLSDGLNFYEEFLHRRSDSPELRR